MLCSKQSFEVLREHEKIPILATILEFCSRQNSIYQFGVLSLVNVSIRGEMES